jgi:hypothetical protein
MFAEPAVGTRATAHPTRFELTLEGLVVGSLSRSQTPMKDWVVLLDSGPHLDDCHISGRCDAGQACQIAAALIREHLVARGHP